MPRGRMLNKEISVNKKLPKVSTEAQLLFTWCIPHLDCEGKIFGNPDQIKGIVVPYLEKFTVKKVETYLKELSDVGLIFIYGNGCKYLYFIGFESNQRIDKSRESPSIIPNPTPAELQQNSSETPHEVKLSKVKISKEEEDGVKIEKQDLEQHLLSCWGRDGKQGNFIMIGFVNQIKIHGHEKVFDAIEEAAKQNKKSLAYVIGILEAHGKKNGTEKRSALSIAKEKGLIK